MVPLQLLIGMFSDGVNSLKELANQRKARVSDLTGNTGARRVRETEYVITSCLFSLVIVIFSAKCRSYNKLKKQLVTFIIAIPDFWQLNSVCGHF